MTDATLVLWDIDQTLIELRGAGREIYQRAFEAVTGCRAERFAEMAGRTDPAIFHDMLGLHGLDGSDDNRFNALFERFAHGLTVAYDAARGLMREAGRALPGAHDALDELQQRPDIIQSVLTGNIASVAVIKLATFGLDRYVDLEVGAYGSDHAQRPRLVGIAKQRARLKYAMRADRARTILIGDTPADIAAGREGGATTVGVATGSFSTTDLAAAGADFVLPDLTSTADLLRACF
jgi:phosphoglycolate phosphatase-like HAD superfamily hydrolase